MSNLEVSLGLAAKLGSIVQHTDEMLSENDPAAIAFDRATIASLTADHEVRDFLDGLRELALLPVPRGGSDG